MPKAKQKSKDKDEGKKKKDTVNEEDKTVKDKKEKGKKREKKKLKSQSNEPEVADGGAVGAADQDKTEDKKGAARGDDEKKEGSKQEQTSKDKEVGRVEKEEKEKKGQEKGAKDKILPAPRKDDRRRSIVGPYCVPVAEIPAIEDKKGDNVRRQKEKTPEKDKQLKKEKEKSPEKDNELKKEKEKSPEKDKEPKKEKEKSPEKERDPKKEKKGEKSRESKKAELNKEKNAEKEEMAKDNKLDKASKKTKEKKKEIVPILTEQSLSELMEMPELIEELRVMLDQHKIEVTEFNDIVNVVDGAVRDLEDRHADLGCQLVWRVDGFYNKFKCAKDHTKPIVFSPSFTTHDRGYKVALSLCPYGDGSFRGKFMSLFFCILKGEHDALLTWPFSLPITVSIVSQAKDPDDRVDHFATFTPNLVTENMVFLGRPVASRNPSLGFPKFIAIDELWEDEFVANDMIFIKVVIDTSDVIRV